VVVGSLKSAINSIDFATIDSSYVKRHGYSQIRCKVRSKYNLYRCTDGQQTTTGSST